MNRAMCGTCERPALDHTKAQAAECGLPPSTLYKIEEAPVSEFVIEVGKSYLTREGGIVRCISIAGKGAGATALFSDARHRWWDSGLHQRGTERSCDIVGYAPQVEEGRKDDAEKAPHHLIAPEMLDALARVLAFGANKYGARNWENGMSWSRPFSALMRHMWAWWRGEGADPETGMSHLWHAACCIMFLVAYEERKSGRDDRP